MKIAGWILLILGFLWIAWDCVSGFTLVQHTRWIAETQHLPEGESIGRDDASAAMRSLALSLKDYHRMLLVPAAMMLLGGVLVASRRKSR